MGCDAPPLPGAGEILFGCRPWGPAMDLSYGAQLPSGLWRLGRARLNRRGCCGGSAGLVRRGRKLYCASCGSYSQDHRLPRVPMVQSYHPEAKPESPPPARKLTRRELRRLKYGGRLPAALAAALAS